MSTRTTSPGKLIRLPAFYDASAWPIILAPVDDHMLFGPFNGLERRDSKVRQLREAGVDIVLTHYGAVARHPSNYVGVPFVINLSASTTMSHHTEKRLITSVSDALSVGASGVAVHVNLASRFAPNMLEDAGRVVSECRTLGVPCLGIVYPRGEAADGTDDNHDELRKRAPTAYADEVAHCVAVGVDLGFDAVKTQYPGTFELFKPAIQAAGDLPVLISGGPVMGDDAVVERARGAFDAGAAGVGFGRNFFGRQDVRPLVEAIRAVRTKRETS